MEKKKKATDFFLNIQFFVLFSRKRKNNKKNLHLEECLTLSYPETILFVKDVTRMLEWAFPSCFLVVFCLFVRSFGFCLQQCWDRGSLEGRMGVSTVASEKIENILIASYLMEELIFSGIFWQCICIALQLSWFVKASCAVSGLSSLKEKKKRCIFWLVQMRAC